MRLIYLLIITTVLSGCISVPTTLNKYSQLEDKPLKKININHISQKEVMNLLGKPDVIRDKDKIWIYSGGKDVGFTVFIFPPLGGINHERIKWLFLRFNEKGTLIEKEIMDSRYGCTKSNFCLPKLHAADIGWKRLKGEREWRLINNKTIILAPNENNDNIPVLENDYCRYFIYGVDDRNLRFFIYDIGFTLIINGNGPYRLNFQTYTYVDLPSGKMSLQIEIEDIDKPTHINNGKNIELFPCNAGETRYLSLRFTNNKKLEKFKQAVNIFEVEPTSANKILKPGWGWAPRKLIVNP